MRLSHGKQRHVNVGVELRKIREIGGDVRQQKHAVKANASKNLRTEAHIVS